MKENEIRAYALWRYELLKNRDQTPPEPAPAVEDAPAEDVQPELADETDAEPAH